MGNRLQQGFGGRGAHGNKSPTDSALRVRLPVPLLGDHVAAQTDEDVATALVPAKVALASDNRLDALWVIDRKVVIHPSLQLRLSHFPTGTPQEPLHFRQAHP